MPILMPASNPDKNDHLYYYTSNTKSSSTSSTNSFKGVSEILENTIHYHEEDMFGSAIRTSETIMSPPLARTDLQENEGSYWADLLNWIDRALPNP